MTTSSGQRALLESVRLTAAAKTARMSLRVSTGASGSDSATGLGVTADGAVDLATGDSQLTMQLGGAMSTFLPGGLEMRSVGGVAYMHFPRSLGGLAMPEGKSWYKIDESTFGGESSSPLGFGSESDPTKFLAYLEKVSDGVHKVGPDTIRGVDTTHYSASLDLGKAVDQADVPPELRKQLAELAHGADAPKIPAEVWVDADGLLRRLELHIDVASFMGGSGAEGDAGSVPTVAVSMDLFDFGAPVHVEAPPADQVATFDPLDVLGGEAVGKRDDAAA